MRFKIDWAGLTVGSKFTVFALFYIVIFQVQAPWRGDLMKGFLSYRLGEPTFRGAYFRNFTVVQNHLNIALLNIL